MNSTYAIGLRIAPLLLLAACGPLPAVDDEAVLEDASLDEEPGELLDLVDDAPDPNEPDELDESFEDAFEEGDEAIEAESDVMFALANAGQYTNPLGPNCADPGIVKIPSADGPTFWAACTGKNFPLFKSRDLVHWTAAGKIFTPATAPAWASGNNWAPEVHRIGGKLVAYFTAMSSSRGRMCIGAARATKMEGPWQDIGRPLVCDPHVSLIDATMHTDPVSGKRFLYYKTDGNGLRPQEKTVIYGHRLKANGIGFIGARKALLKNTLAWEGDVVEAPWVIHRGNFYYMFYSGFRYCNETYGVGVARSRSPLGPFTKRGAPILRSNGTWGGPGHNSFVRAAGKPYLVYHAWEAPHSCDDAGTRKLMLDRVTWSGGWPVINNGTPSIGARAAPFAQ